MAILNFNFTKIHVEKQANISKEIKIQSNMHLIDVTSSKVSAGSKQQAFVISFAFDVLYEPKIGKTNLEGNLLYLADEKEAKEIEKVWADKKVLPKDVTIQVFNRILHNCNVEALILSRDINLPSPVQLPKVRVETPVVKTKSK